MTPLERGPRLVKLWTALILFGTFLSGIAVGVGAARFSNTRRPHLPHLPGPPPFLPGMHPDTLGLNADQEKQLRAINERYRPAIEDVIRASFPKLRELNEKMEKDVREILTDDQRRRFDEIRRLHPPPPGAPGAPPFGGPGGPPPPFPPGMGMPGHRMPPPPPGEIPPNHP